MRTRARLAPRSRIGLCDVGDVIQFPGSSTAPIQPPLILEQAATHEFESVVVLGFTADGNLYAASSTADAGTVERIFRTSFADPWDEEVEHAAELVISEIKWPYFKPPAMVTLDDRAITFRGRWPHPAALLDFVPWNKGGLVMSDVEPVTVSGLTVAQITALAAKFQSTSGYDPRALTAEEIGRMRP